MGKTWLFEGVAQSFARLQSALLCHLCPPAPAQATMHNQDPSSLAPECLNPSWPWRDWRGQPLLHLRKNSSRLSLNAKVPTEFLLTVALETL